MAKGVKTGGRTNGTPNKLPAELRQRMSSEVDPVKFLAAYVNGEPICTVDASGNAVEEVAPLDKRKEVALKVLDKLVPSPKESESTLNLNGSHEQWLLWLDRDTPPEHLEAQGDSAAPQDKMH